MIFTRQLWNLRDWPGKTFVIALDIFLRHLTYYASIISNATLSIKFSKVIYTHNKAPLEEKPTMLHKLFSEFTNMWVNFWHFQFQNVCFLTMIPTIMNQLVFFLPNCKWRWHSNKGGGTRSMLNINDLFLHTRHSPCFFVSDRSQMRTKTI